MYSAYKGRGVEVWVGEAIGVARIFRVQKKGRANFFMRKVKKGLLIFLLTLFMLPCKFCGKVLFYLEQEKRPEPSETFPGSGEVHLGKSGERPEPGSLIVCEWCGKSPTGIPHVSDLREE